MAETPIKTLAVITARGGSKGLPGKNIKPLAGKPLIAWSIDSVKNATTVSRCIVSTDSEEIASVAKEYGGEVPFIRPAELAEDKTPHLPVMQHALREMERLDNTQYDIIVTIQPTSPFREPEYIDDTVTALHESDADSAVTIFEIDSGYHPIKIKKFVDGYVLPYVETEAEGTLRQDIPPAYKRSSHVYATKRSCLIDKDNFYGDKIRGIEVPKKWYVDIDGPEDWEQAERIAEKWIKEKGA